MTPTYRTTGNRRPDAVGYQHARRNDGARLVTDDARITLRDWLAIIAVGLVLAVVANGGLILGAMK